MALVVVLFSYQNSSCKTAAPFHFAWIGLLSMQGSVSILLTLDFPFLSSLLNEEQTTRLPLRCFTADSIITSDAQARRQRSCQPSFFTAADISSNSFWMQQCGVLHFIVCFVANRTQYFSSCSAKTPVSQMQRIPVIDTDICGPLQLHFWTI